MFDPQGMCSLMAIFPKNRFPAIFDAHLEFLCKTQQQNKKMHLYWAAIAYHVELNANSGGHRHPANVQEK